uniref:PDC2 n=1 Tax=Arundo donax TaxID=35708 RepID=A0A0A9E510_ARUDO
MEGTQSRWRSMTVLTMSSRIGTTLVWWKHSTMARASATQQRFELRRS